MTVEAPAFRTETRPRGPLHWHGIVASVIVACWVESNLGIGRSREGMDR